MQLRVVEVEHEQGQFHDLKVEDNVPEDGSMLTEEGLFEDYLLAFLLYDVNVLFVETYWRKKLNT